MVCFINAKKRKKKETKMTWKKYFLLSCLVIFSIFSINTLQVNLFSPFVSTSWEVDKAGSKRKKILPAPSGEWLEINYLESRHGECENKESKKMKQKVSFRIFFLNFYPFSFGE